MSEAKYERLKTELDVHLQHEQIDDNETETKIEPGKQSNTGFIQIFTSIIPLILVYFALSIGLTFYQRWLLRDVKIPLFIVAYHLVVKFLLAAIVRLFYRLKTGKVRVKLDCRTSTKRVAPSGIACGFDIGFSNWGLELVTISLYTMTKSTTIIFILFFAVLLGLEKKSWSLMAIVIMISGGLIMFTYKSTQFNALGFCFLLFASLSSGVRWTFVQMIMQKSKLGLNNPIDMAYQMQPWMLIAVLPFALGFEGEKVLNGIKTLPDYTSDEILFFWIKISIGAVIAFIMELSEFLLISMTSSLTLSVAGIFKEILQLILAVNINGDQLTVINIFGLIMCLGGISCHVIHKYFIMLSTNSNHLNIECCNNSLNELNQMQLHEKQQQQQQQQQQQVQQNLQQHQVKLKNHTDQNIPLLLNSEDSDSDNSQYDKQNASEVIFDVLKRRDNRR